MKAGWPASPGVAGTKGHDSTGRLPVSRLSGRIATYGTAETSARSYQYKLTPTPEQARALDRTLMLCRHVYNAAVGERREAWRMRGVSCRPTTSSKPSCPASKRRCRRYAEVHSSGLARRRVAGIPSASGVLPAHAEKGGHQGYPRFHGRVAAITPSPIRRSASMAAHPSTEERTMAFLVLSKIGRIAVRLVAPN